MKEADRFTDIHELWHPLVGVAHDFDGEMKKVFQDAGASVLYSRIDEVGLTMEVTGISREDVIRIAGNAMEVMPQPDRRLRHLKN